MSTTAPQGEKVDANLELQPVEQPSVHNDSPKLSWKKKLLYHLWDSDQHLKSPEERAFVRKLDCGILVCATLGWWMKYIDQYNIVNAYVTGMKEELDMIGNEYTYCLTLYFIAFAIGQIPASYLCLKFRPKLCIIIAELGWTVFTFAQAGASSVHQMYAFRFMVGLFGSAFQPIMIFLMGSWYTKPELAKRMAIYLLTGFFGSATSGFLQAGIQASLDGHLGLSGWRWLYIICGCMSTPVAISVWYLLPDFPHNTKAWYLNENDKEIAMRRVRDNGIVPVTGKVNIKLGKRMFTSWRWYVLVIMYVCYGNSCQSNQYFAIYLKSAKFDATKRNVIPACANLVTMITEFTWSFMSDMTGSRYWWSVIPIVFTSMLGASILTAWPDPVAAKIVAFFFTAGGYATGVVFSWANEINNGNAEERALTIASMNGIYFASNAGLPIALFPQTMAPNFPRGFPAIIGFCIASILLMTLAEWLHRKQLRNEEKLRNEMIPSELEEKDQTEKDALDTVDAEVNPAVARMQNQLNG